jgi:hypothetical protein
MNFWKRLQRIGSGLALAVLTVALLLASAFPPPATHSAHPRTVPVPSPGPDGSIGTIGTTGL